MELKPLLILALAACVPAQKKLVLPDSMVKDHVATPGPTVAPGPGYASPKT